jgi:hypothetical protein
MKSNLTQSGWPSSRNKQKSEKKEPLSPTRAARNQCGLPQENKNRITV